MPQFDFGIGKEYTKVDVSKRKPAKNSIPVSSTELVKPRTTRKRGPSGKKGESLGLPPANRLTNPESLLELSPDSGGRRSGEFLSRPQSLSSARSQDTSNIEWAGREIDRVYGSTIPEEMRQDMISWLWAQADGGTYDKGRGGFQTLFNQLHKAVQDGKLPSIRAEAKAYRERRDKSNNAAGVPEADRMDYEFMPITGGRAQLQEFLASRPDLTMEDLKFEPDGIRYPKAGEVDKARQIAAKNQTLGYLGLSPNTTMKPEEIGAIRPEIARRYNAREELEYRSKMPGGLPEEYDQIIKEEGQPVGFGGNSSFQNAGREPTLLQRYFGSNAKSAMRQGKVFNPSGFEMSMILANDLVNPTTGTLKTITGDAQEDWDPAVRAFGQTMDFVGQIVASGGMAAAASGAVNAGKISSLLMKAGIPAKYTPQVLRASSAVAHIGEALPAFMALDVPGYATMIIDAGGDVGKAARLFGQGMADGFNPATYTDPSKQVDEKIGAAINAVTGLMIGVGLSARAASAVGGIKQKPSQYATLTPTEIGSIKLAGNFLDSSGIQLPNEWIKKQAKTLVELRRAGIEDPETVARHMTLVEFASDKSGQSAAKSAAALLEGGQMDRAIPERVGENQAPEVNPVAIDAPAVQNRPESQIAGVPEAQGVNPFAIEELAPDRMNDQVPDTGNMVDAPRANFVPDEARADFEDFRSMMEQEFSPGDKTAPVDAPAAKVDDVPQMEADTDPGSIFDPADAMQEPVEVTMPSAKVNPDIESKTKSRSGGKAEKTVSDVDMETPPTTFADFRSRVESKLRGKLNPNASYAKALYEAIPEGQRTPEDVTNLSNAFTFSDDKDAGAALQVTMQRMSNRAKEFEAPKKQKTTAKGKEKTSPATPASVKTKISGSAPSEPTSRIKVGGVEYELSGKAKAAYDKLVSEKVKRINRNPGPEGAAVRKATSMEFSAELRKLVGAQTAKEAAGSMASANKVAPGDKVTLSDGTNWTVKSNAFGKVNLTKPDGSTRSVERSEIPNRAQQANTPTEGVRRITEVDPVQQSGSKSEGLPEADPVTPKTETEQVQNEVPETGSKTEKSTGGDPAAKGADNESSKESDTTLVADPKAKKEDPSNEGQQAAEIDPQNNFLKDVEADEKVNSTEETKTPQIEGDQVEGESKQPKSTEQTVPDENSNEVPINEPLSKEQRELAEATAVADIENQIKSEDEGKESEATQEAKDGSEKTEPSNNSDKNQSKSDGILGMPNQVGPETDPRLIARDWQDIEPLPLEPGESAKGLHSRDILLEIPLEITGKWRTGKTLRGLVGQFDAKNKVITMRYGGNVFDFAHEIGHRLDDLFSLVPQMNAAKLKSGKDSSTYLQFDKELVPMGTRYAPSGDLMRRRQEGIARYVQLYMTNPAKAKAQAPEFTKYFEQQVPKAVLSDLKSIGVRIRKLKGLNILDAGAQSIEMNPSDAKTKLDWVKSMLGQNQSDPFPFYSYTKGFRQAWIDDLAVLEATEKEAVKRSGLMEILPSESPTMLARRMKYHNQRVNSIIEFGMIDSQGNAVTSPIKSIFETLDTTSTEAFETDLKHMFLLGIGERTLEEAGRIRKNAEFEAESASLAGNPGLAEKIILEAEARVENLTGLGQNGFFGTDIDAASAILTELKADPERFDRLNVSLTKMRGIYDATIQYMVAKGRLSQEDGDQIRDTHQHYIALKRIMDGDNDLTFLRQPSGNLGRTTQPIKTFKGSTRKIQSPLLSLLEQIEQTVFEADRNEIVRSMVDLLGGKESAMYLDGGDFSDLALKVPLQDESKTSIVVFRNGERERWELDPALYQALNIVGTPYAPELKGLRMITQFVRGAITTFPAFAFFKNPIRDTAARLIHSRTGSAFKTMTFKPTPQERAMYTMFGGGLMELEYMSGRKVFENAQKTLMENAVKTQPKGWVIGTPADLWKGYLQAASVPEMANRMAEYNQALKVGRLKFKNEYDAHLYASQEARDLQDFLRAGTIARRVNGYVPFFNAAIQGLDRTKRGFKSDPAGYAKRLLLYSVTLEVVAFAIAQLQGDDVGEKYDQLPAFQKDFFWNIYVGDGAGNEAGFLRIPKPFELGLPASYVGRLMSYIRNKARGDEAAAAKFQEGFGGSLGKSLIIVDESVFTGGAMAPLTEVMANKDFFRDKEIVSPFEKDLILDFRKGTERASGVGQILQKISQDRGKGVDARNFDHLIAGFFGSYGRSLTAATSRDLSAGDWANILTGLWSSPPAYNARDVAWVRRTSKAIGLNKSPLSEEQDAFFRAKSPEEKKRAGEKLLKRGIDLRRDMEAAALGIQDEVKRANAMRHKLGYDPIDPEKRKKEK